MFWTIREPVRVGVRVFDVRRRLSRVDVAKPSVVGALTIENVSEEVRDRVAAPHCAYRTAKL